MSVKNVNLLNIIKPVVRIITIGS